MAATMSSQATCPDACPLKGKECYAGQGPMSWAWNKLTAGTIGHDFDFLITEIKRLPVGYKMRLNQSGDLPGVNNRIDAKKLSKLVQASKHIKGFTYTHKPIRASKKHNVSPLLAKKNRQAIADANKGGFTINVSTNRIEEVDQALRANIGPVVTILPIGSSNTVYTAKGTKVIKCPAQRFESMTCAKCMLCQKTDRSVVVGFEAHGAKKNSLSKSITA